ncbi:MAG: hypothetical protein II999_07975 [Bacteroidaceae bacterium]|nr:hypothetical protein [Bacteroidaceae bacterium]
MKNYKKEMHVALMCILGVATSCKPDDEEAVCQTAKDFAETYYNLDIQKARHYCTKELESVMNFRHSSTTEKEKSMKEQVGSARIRIIDCELNEEKSEASVRIEVSNFLRRNYLTDQVSLVASDTFELTLIKQIDGVWRIKKPF